MVALSGALRTLAGALMKIANDVRWYASGPRAESANSAFPITNPALPSCPAKSIPPSAKRITMVAAQVFGNDHAVAFAGSQGNFQLNVFKPVILHNVLVSTDLLADGCRSFARRCAAGIEPNRRRIQEHLKSALMVVTALNPHIGYEKAAEISLHWHIAKK